MYECMNGNQSITVTQTGEAPGLEREEGLASTTWLRLPEQQEASETSLLGSQHPPRKPGSASARPWFPSRADLTLLL